MCCFVSIHRMHCAPWTVGAFTTGFGLLKRVSHSVRWNGMNIPTSLGRQSQAIPQTAQTFWILKDILILQVFLLRLESLRILAQWVYSILNFGGAVFDNLYMVWHPNGPHPFDMSKYLEKVLFLDVFGGASSLPLSNSVVWSNNESDHVWSEFYSQAGTWAQDCHSKLPFMSVHSVPGFGGRIIHNHTQT